MANEVAVVEPKNTAMAAFDYGDDKGAGYEGMSANDISVPYLSILQTGSPEVSGEQHERIPGAEAGRLYNTVTKQLYPAEGLVIQPVCQDHCFVEWKPRTSGGGFVKKHGQYDDIVKAAKAASTEFGKYKTPSGNDLVETIYMVALIHASADLKVASDNFAPAPIILTFSSTKLKPIKDFNNRMYTLVVSGGKPPMFANRIVVKTVSETRSKGKSYNYAFTAPVENNLELSLIPPKLGTDPNPMLVAGRELKKAADSGAFAINHTAAKDGGAKGDQGGSDEEIPF